MSLIQITTVAPPHPSTLCPSHSENHLLSRAIYDRIPRPAIEVPVWVREVAPAILPRLLVSFRTLLCAQSLFVRAEIAEPISTAAVAERFAIDICLHNDDVAAANPAERLTLGWASHLQNVSELIETGIRQLAQGNFTASAALIRTALEIASRLQNGIDALRLSQDENGRDEIIDWIFAGDGRLQTAESSISERVRASIAAANAYLQDVLEAPIADRAYSELCDMAHPGTRNRSGYLQRSEGEARFSPPQAPFSVRDRGQARKLLAGVTAATGAMLNSWHRVSAALGTLAEQGSVQSQVYAYSHETAADLFASYQDQDLTRNLAYPIHLMLRYTAFNDSPLPMGAINDALIYSEKWLLGRSWHQTASNDDALSAWKGVRMWLCSELLQALVLSLNRGECVSSAAIARFLMEHLASLEHAQTYRDAQERCVALREGDFRRPSDEWIDELLDLTNMRVHAHMMNPELTEAARLIRDSSSGFVHGDFASRSIYWTRYGRDRETLLRIPGRQVFSSDILSMPIENPWIFSGTTALFADYVISAECRERGAS